MAVIPLKIHHINMVFGFGRALETFLGFVGVTWALVLMLGAGAYQSVILYDMKELVLGIPLLLLSLVSLAGVVCNIIGYRIGKLLRVVGTIGCMLIWNWVTWKAVLVNAQDLLAFSFSIWTLPAYFWILMTALMDLPPPGEAVDGGTLIK